MTDPTCGKCDGAMELGFLPDHTYGANLVARWAAGAPVASFWTNTKLKGVETIPVGTYRCTRCGYLESYARPEFAKRSNG
jgi:hypothetical protein